jgi:hypothetical protein
MFSGRTHRSGIRAQLVRDTSGSMPPRLLAVALGAIASYGMSREVPPVRVVAVRRPDA